MRRAKRTAGAGPQVRATGGGICGNLSALMSKTTLNLPDDHGFVRQWLIAGPVESPYVGPTDRGDDLMRSSAIDVNILPAPPQPALGQEGPEGTRWAVHEAGNNVFIERSDFWYSLVHVQAWFATELHVESAMVVPVWLWAAGCADLYCNGQHVGRNNCPRYMYPMRQRVDLPLRAGVNHLSVRLQVLGLRDSRFLFGVQCVDARAPLKISLPGQSLSDAAPSQTTQGRKSNDPTLLQMPNSSDATKRAARGSGADQDSRRRSHMIPSMDMVAKITASHGILCARSIGIERDSDEQTIAQTCDWIDGRPDCADFAMAAVLRLAALNWVTDTQRQRIKKTALQFRYWPDEAGSDAMCFTSENHRLLFHSAQLLAGRLWPGERFIASGRSGQEQAAMGLARCAKWIDEVEARGLREYHSCGYIPITIAALMNLVDFSGDASQSRRAAALVDGIYRVLADHAFDGVVITPQGRVYRQVLEPKSTGTQALLSYAVDQAVVAHDIWLGFLASSPSYLPPNDLAERMAQSIHRRYRQHTTDIVLHKTADYILTSVEIGPARRPSEDPSGDHERGLIAGLAGYQQHIWQATLSENCHVFVNHPGEWIDMGKARPGYWYGNGVLPRTEQRDHLLLQIHCVNDEHPVPFVHAHWPVDVFDESTTDNLWHIARCGRGYVGLWCSHRLVPHDQILVGRELRAWTQQSAWVCVCGSIKDHADLQSFKAYCRSLDPRFDEDQKVLHLSSGAPLSWQ